MYLGGMGVVVRAGILGRMIEWLGKRGSPGSALYCWRSDWRPSQRYILI
jgi:hypothetical protein